MPRPNSDRHLELWPRERLLRDLNERLFSVTHYHAAVFLERGDREVNVLKAEGALRRESGLAEKHVPREDDLSGTYSVGEAVLDLSDALPHLEVADMPVIGLLEVKLAEGVWLRLVPSQFAPRDNST